MRCQSPIAAIAIMAALCAAASPARAHDEAKYPDWSGQWRRPAMALQWDTSKPMGRGQQAPLTPEYQAIFEAGLRSQREGGQGNDPRYSCMPQGMPRVMSALFPFEVIIQPRVTHILFENHYPRRIYTDGRGWPTTELEPSFVGYSTGRWIDEDGDGRFDVLEAETRNIRNPRTFEPSGLPFHKDGKTVVKERIYLDKADKTLLIADITTIDNALTRPWSVKQAYRRETRDELWVDNTCAENNSHVIIGAEHYFLSGERLLMPVRRGQPPPDLRYFPNSR